MASLRQAVVFLFLGVTLTSADRMDIILKRLEEMDKQLRNQNERIVELEEQLETVNLQKTAEIAKLQEQLEVYDEKISKLIDKKAESANKQTENVDNLAENVDNLVESADNQAENVDNLAENVDNQAENDGREGYLFADKLDHGDKQRKEKKTITDDFHTRITGMRARSPLSRRLVLGEGMQVAFSATITPHDYGPVGAGQIVQFDKVISNVGNAYHAHSGIFTAPVNGVYVIHATISGWTHTMGQSYLEIMKNGNHLYEIWVDRGHQSSQSVIVDLNQGDEIYVKNGVANDVLLGATYSSFSGFLLYLE